MKLTLTSPLTSKIITQRFGENGSPVYAGYGMKGHSGIDYRAPHGTPVYACHDGTAYYQIDGNGGHGVVIITDKKYEYEGDEAYFKTIYWHLVDPIADPRYKSPLQDFPWGKKVVQEDLIGYADNTGVSSGSHLHFGLKPVAKTGEDNKSWMNLEQNNGYFGAIDPAPYLGLDSPFLIDLQLNMSHPDVVRLQRFLNSLGFVVAYNGPGSINNETSFYGQLTFNTVARFQEAFSIARKGQPGYGRCGPVTRKKINSLLQ